MKNKIYKVDFSVRVWCGGVYRYLPATLHIPAVDEKEAAEKIRNSRFDINVSKVTNIDLSETIRERIQ